MKNILLIAILFVAIPKRPQAQVSYFPPINNNLPWDTISPNSLGWCNNKINELYSFLQQENSKAFIVLKDGKIVLEKYFGTFIKDSNWYWASAGKTLTGFCVGIAQAEGKLKITDQSSKYLGSGWTSLNHKGYVIYTAHFIDSSTWKLHAIVMGLYEKDGGSKH